MVHPRIRIHFCLTTIALAVNILITAGGVCYIVAGGPLWLFFYSWIGRYVHIGLDTLVLYGALSVPSFNLELEECDEVASSTLSCDDTDSTAAPGKCSSVFCVTGNRRWCSAPSLTAFQPWRQAPFCNETRVSSQIHSRPNSSFPACADS